MQSGTKHHFLASIDVDAQKGFSELCPNELPVSGALEIVPELNAQAKLAAFRIGSKDAHSVNAKWVTQNLKDIQSPTHLPNCPHKWPIHCVPGTVGFESLPGLPQPTDYDFFVFKGVEPDLHPYGICYHDIQQTLSTGLLEFLMKQGIETVVVGGLSTDYCVKQSVLELCAAGVNVLVNLAACRGIHPTSTETALAIMQDAGAKLISSHQELL